MLWCLYSYVVSDLEYPLLQERAFCMEELRPQPIIKKRSRFFIPEEMKVMNNKNKTPIIEVAKIIFVFSI
jgi:hypothetical protein